MSISLQKDNLTSNSNIVQNTASSPQRNSDDEIDLNQLPAGVSKKGSSPQEIALAVFGNQETEGLIKEDVEVDASDPKQTIVIITQTNLPDDSVDSIRYRIDFQSVHSQWQIKWAGQQFICQPGRGNQDWSKELCY